MAIDTSNLLSRLSGPSALASGTSTVFTGTTGHVYTIRKIRVVNTDTSNAKTIQFFVNGSTQALSVTPVLTIDASGYADSDDFIVLSGAETLQVTTSATGLTLSMYGLDQS